MRIRKCRRPVASFIAIAAFIIVPAIFVVASASDVKASIGQGVNDIIFLESDAAVLFFSVSDDISSWSLNPKSNPASVQGSLTINADSAWSVMVTSNNGGYLKEYNNNAYGSKTLKNPLNIGVQSTSSYTGHKVSLNEGGTLVEGSGPYSGTIPFTYEQNVDWTDAPQSYRIELTFTTSPT